MNGKTNYQMQYIQTSSDMWDLSFIKHTHTHTKSFLNKSFFLYPLGQNGINSNWQSARTSTDTTEQTEGMGWMEKEHLYSTCW